MEEEKIFYENLPEASENSESSENSETSEASESSESSEDSENSESPEPSPEADAVRNAEEKPEEDDSPEEPESRFRNFDALAAAFAKGRGISAEEREATLQTVHRIADSIRDGEGAPEIFEIIRKGMDYDNAVSKAAADGELKGRNTKIQDLYFREIPDDGLPHFQGSHANIRKDSAATIFDLARQA